MLHTTLLIFTEIRMAQEGVLFFSFSIKRNWAAFWSAFLNAEDADLRDFCRFIRSLFSPSTSKVFPLLIIHKESPFSTECH
uniref:Uncharacterized protein n=1 Tax=Arundo donax TaxID=35708 RepID=A0A0A9DNE1_ARUDO